MGSVFKTINRLAGRQTKTSVAATVHKTDNSPCNEDDDISASITGDPDPQNLAGGVGGSVLGNYSLVSKAQKRYFPKDSRQ